MRTFAGLFFYLAFFSLQVRAQSIPLTPGNFVTGSAFLDAAAFLDVNRDGSIDILSPSFLLGTYLVNLDERGQKLGESAHMAFPSGFLSGLTAPSVKNLVSGFIDSDFRKDLIVATSDGVLHFLKNRGSGALGQISFDPAILVDNFSGILRAPGLDCQTHLPVIKIKDVDQDGINDIYLAGGQVNNWNGTTRSGFFRFYKGVGNGSFQSFSLTLPGNVIDADFVDLNGDTIDDTFVIVTETGGPYSFTNEVHHAVFNNSILTFSKPPQIMGIGKITSLEVIDVAGDTNKDYVFSTNHNATTQLSAQIFYYEGNGLGDVGPAWGTLTLPTNSTGLGDHIESLRAVDIDGDSIEELVALRGYSSPGTLSTYAQFTDADLFVFRGPNIAFATPTVVPLNGRYFTQWVGSGLNLYFAQPLSPAPNMLHVVDFGEDGRPDVFIQGLYQVAQTQNGPVNRAGGLPVLNALSPANGASGFEKIGEPPGGNPQRPSRIGFDGGPAKLGNNNFSATLQNVPGGSLVGLMWGSYASANLIQHGPINIHLVPQEFSHLRIVPGLPNQQGFTALPLPIPNNPALVGHAGYFQFNHFDVTSNSLGSTQATGVIIGP